MGNIYIAINGDDVGQKIGEHIANDDHEGLASASSAIQGAHDNIDQWVESVGGKKITGTGDEAIYIIPEQHADDLDQIKDQYSQGSGHGLTIGTGSSMSEASKALIYGKLNGKNQVVHYEPQIEDYLSDEDGDDQEAEQGDDQELGGMPAPDQIQDQADEESEQEEGLEPEGADDQEAEEEIPEEGQEAAPGPADEDIQADESPEDSAPSMEAEADAEPDQEQDEDSEEMDESDPDQEQPGLPPKKAQSMPVSDESQEPGMDGDIDDEDFGADEAPAQEGDGDQDESAEMPMNEEAPEEGDEQEMPMDEEEAPQEGMAPPQGKSVYQELNQDDEGGEEEEQESAPEEGDEEGSYDHNDAMADMIQGDMESDDDSEDQDPNAMPEEGMEDQDPNAVPGEDIQPDEGSEMHDDEGAEGDSALDDSLRQDIASALMGFKENKDMLEQAREQNPKLYQATITMLQSMIAMAKKLGYAPEQDMQDAEGQQDLQEGFPGADEEGGEEEQQDMTPQEGDEEPMQDAQQGQKGIPPGKK